MSQSEAGAFPPISKNEVEASFQVNSVHAALILLSFADTVFFPQIEGLWPPTSNKSSGAIFPAAFAHHVSLSHFGSSHHTSDFSLYLFWGTVMGDF